MVRLGIDLGGTAVKLGVVGDDAGTSWLELPVPDETAGLGAIGSAARDLAGGAVIDGVGIAVPGVVDRDRRALVKAHDKYSALLGVDLTAWAHEQFGAPAIVENDARSALLGEVRDGAAAGADDAVLMVLGTGIGTAAMMGGLLLRGAHGHAGILGGHFAVDLDGAPCPCGNIGCAEAVASTWALDRDVRAGAVAAGPALRARAERGRLGVRDLAETAHEAESAALLDRLARVWGAVLVDLCHAYDPDVVVVTGGILRAADTLLPTMRAHLNDHLWSSSHRPAVVVPERPETSVLRGLDALASEVASRPLQQRGNR
jgi:glucokinase